MNESLADKARRLLGTCEIPGNASQQEKFFIRILELAALNGDHWVCDHRDALLEQWVRTLERSWVR